MITPIAVSKTVRGEALSVGISGWSTISTPPAFVMRTISVGATLAKAPATRQAKAGSVEVMTTSSSWVSVMTDGQHAHLPALALRITDLDRQSASRPPCLRILQNTVQDRQDVMHGLDRQPVRFKQFPREGIDRRGADAAQSAAAQPRLDMPLQDRPVFDVA